MEHILIKVTCTDCKDLYQTSIPKSAWEDYQTGMNPDIAFYGVTENARNLVQHKMCPPCISNTERAARDGW